MKHDTLEVGGTLEGESWNEIHAQIANFFLGREGWKTHDEYIITIRRRLMM